MPIDPSRFLEIGFIARPHGVQGELRLRLHWNESESLSEVTRIRLIRAERDTEFRITGMRRADRDLLIRLEGISDRNDAEPLKGARVYVHREDLPALDSGEYYLVDLIGCSVFGPEGLVGTVQQVRTHPTVDSIVITTPDGVEIEQPMIPQWVQSVDLEQRRIELSSTDALLR